jgi:hypothetical protein
LRGLRGCLGRRRRRILGGDANRGRSENNQDKARQFWPTEYHVPVDPILHGNAIRRQVTPPRIKMQMRGGMLLGLDCRVGRERCIARNMVLRHI